MFILKTWKLVCYCRGIGHIMVGGQKKSATLQLFLISKLK